MEVEGGDKRKSIVCLYEFIGTTFFVYLVLMSTGNPIAVPLALFSMIIIFGDVSGGHFNPAVTLGIYVWKGEYSKNFFFSDAIMLSQIVGAFAGMGLAILTLSTVIDGVYRVPEQYVPILCPKDPEDPSQCKTEDLN